jgi:indolepyruvate ferredoxin oxidoreductase beta subunit
MKCDVILAGVGGQGVLSVSATIAHSALREGLHVKQSEVHGMAQRGGAVMASVRLSDEPIYSDLIPRGSADLILSMEPLESLRYLAWLKWDGIVVTATGPVRNIPDYPELETVLARIRTLPRSHLVDAEALARRCANPMTTNVVMVGAASHLLPIRPETIADHIRETFARKGESVVTDNLNAFRAGRETVH